jgi:hypothetical protein
MSENNQQADRFAEKTVRQNKNIDVKFTDVFLRTH